MSVIWIERRAGETTITAVDYESGVKTSLAKAKRAKAKNNDRGYYHVSDTNGFIGTKKDLERQIAIDRANGAPAIDYLKVRERISSRTGRLVGVYKAAFADRSERANWLRATRRVDSDAGYREPAPGDFRNTVPPEFYGVTFE